MADPVITVEHLCKDYTIAHESGPARYRTLRDTLAGWFSGGRRTATHETFHALDDVSFQVPRGEVLGIIGRNGAGKSTLLKILSRITEPTRGRVTLRGRVASLLEVGTGFHPELTGRENIFLNGAILGMTRAEIRGKFDAIVDFSGIEQFLDTPVKRFSSGMYVRLAFAVAAHLDPEILVVDEVLAVGDQQFQKKCLGKMREVSSAGGRTVLFVSHNLSVIRQICPQALLLDRGRVAAQGPSAAVIAAYHRSMESTGTLPAGAGGRTDEAGGARFTFAALEDTGGRPLQSARIGQPWRMRIRFEVLRPLQTCVLSVGAVTGEGLPLQTCWAPPADLAPGNYEAVFSQDSVCLAADTYKLILGLTEAGRSLHQFEAARLEITTENPLIPCEAASGCGLVLNSMNVAVSRL